MTGAKRKFKREIYTLGAGERLQLSIVAAWLTILASTKAFEVGIDDEDPQPIEAGLAINTDGYQKVVLRNPHGEAITVDVAFTSSEMRDSRLTASGVVNIAQTDTLDVRESLANSLSPGIVTAVPALGAATLRGADPTRRKLILKNVGAVTVWLGVGSGEYGHPFAPGEILEVENTAQVRGYNANLTPGKVSVLVERAE